MLNKAVCKALKSPDKGLRCKGLDAETLYIRVYGDASFASNDDMASQIGSLSLLCDKNVNCKVIDYASRKSKRVVRSVIEGDLYACTDATHAKIVLSVDLSRAVGRKLPIHMFTDCKQVFDVETRGKRPTEKRMAIDITAACGAYRQFDIDRVGLVLGEHNPAGALSKAKNSIELQHILVNNKDSTPAPEWIIPTVNKNCQRDKTNPGNTNRHSNEKENCGDVAD